MNRSRNDPKQATRKRFDWSIICCAVETLALEVANQSWRISAIRSTSGWSVRIIRSSHQRWSWPQASAGGGRGGRWGGGGGGGGGAGPRRPGRGQGRARPDESPRGELIGLSGDRPEPCPVEQAHGLVVAERALVGARRARIGVDGDRSDVADTFRWFRARPAIVVAGRFVFVADDVA